MTLRSRPIPNLGDLVQGAIELVRTGGDARLVSAVTGWRSQTSEALLVIDRSRSFSRYPEETQQRFVALLGPLTEETDVHVLSLFATIFSSAVTAFRSLPRVSRCNAPGSAFRGGLASGAVEPAARQGVRFEDGPLVAEMVASVEKERAPCRSLPLPPRGCGRSGTGRGGS